MGRRVGLKQRRKVIERDGQHCYLCTRLCIVYPENKGKQRPNTLTIDHIIPLSRGGTDSIFNLAVCCATCNGSKDDLFPAGRRNEAMLQIMGVRLLYGIPYRPPGFIVRRP